MTLHGVEVDDLMERIVANIGSLQIVQNTAENLRIFLDSYFSDDPFRYTSPVAPKWRSLTLAQREEMSHAVGICYTAWKRAGWIPRYDASPFVERPDNRDQPRYIEPAGPAKRRVLLDETSPAQDNAIRHLEGE